MSVHLYLYTGTRRSKYRGAQNIIRPPAGASSVCAMAYAPEIIYFIHFFFSCIIHIYVCVRYTIAGISPRLYLAEYTEPAERDRTPRHRIKTQRPPPDGRPSSTPLSPPVIAVATGCRARVCFYTYLRVKNTHTIMYIHRYVYVYV